jgi:hypothetical protein
MPNPFPLTSLAKPLVVVAGNLTGMRYRDEIVQPYVIPFIQGILFQMRINAGPISAKVTG